MCTAICIHEKCALFGRTLDLEDSLGAGVVLTPRGYDFGKSITSRYAIVGMGIVSEGRALYFDAMNEKGLWVAALNFPTCSVYRKVEKCKLNLASYEILPYILANFATAKEAEENLKELNITDKAFSIKLPPTPLHWIISDGKEALTLESTEAGVRLVKNPVGILTNSPDFDFHMTRLADFSTLSACDGKNRLTDFPITPYSRGLGAMGLPGDFSSSSRFVKAVFLKRFTLTDRHKNADISRIFHILDGISVPDGCIITREGRPVRTVYSSVASPTEKTYYFTSYGCRTPHAVRLDSEITELKTFSIDRDEIIEHLN